MGWKLECHREAPIVSSLLAAALLVAKTKEGQEIPVRIGDGIPAGSVGLTIVQRRPQ